MQFFQGKSVSQGITMGPVVIWRKKKFIVERKQIADAEAENVRLDMALEQSRAQLLELQKKVSESDEAGSAIFEAHILLLEDTGFLGAIRDIVRTERVNAEYAVQVTGEKYAQMFAAMEDKYMCERAADIKDIAGRLVQNLCGYEITVPVLEESSIILAEELSPSETMQFDRKKVLAFVTVQGSFHSHAAILARTMNIPALVGVEIDLEKAAPALAVVDALQGRLIIDPDRETLAETEQKICKAQEDRRLLREMKDMESVTRDGHAVPICANVGNLADMESALENGADGIGLFRSEFLYLGRESAPIEEEQYQAYTQAAQLMSGKEVVIRTLDIGADKQVEYLHLEEETNPALGNRGIRVCLKYPDIFKVQLRALLRAAVCGNISVMYPMIISAEEVEQINAMVKEVAAQLEQDGIPYKIPAQGIMIETPAAVMVSDELAEMVDFFSIGTNDLIQYTLAVDRQNSKLDDFYNPRHKAILRMIQMVVENAHKAGKWVGICGELAGDMTLTKSFVRMGVDELSVVPGKVLELRKLVREMKADE